MYVPPDPKPPVEPALLPPKSVDPPKLEPVPKPKCNRVSDRDVLEPFDSPLGRSTRLMASLSTKSTQNMTYLCLYYYYCSHRNHQTPCFGYSAQNHRSPTSSLMMSTVSVIGVSEVVDDIKRRRKFGGTLRRSVESNG